MSIASTTLAAAVDSKATTFLLTSASDFPAVGTKGVQQLMRVEDEVLLVDAVLATNTVHVRTRGSNGSSAVAHAAAALVQTSADLADWPTLATTLPTLSAQLTGQLRDETGTGAAVFGTSPTIGTPVLNGTPTGTMFVHRTIKTAILALSGTTIHSGTTVGWTSPESTAILVQRVVLDVTTVASGACTLDVGVTATGATTASDTLLDGVDVHTAVAVFDSLDPALDTGTNAHAQKLAAGKFVTVTEASGNATALVGNLYIQYVLI